MKFKNTFRRVCAVAAACICIGAGYAFSENGISVNSYAETAYTETAPQYELTVAPASSFTYSVSGNNATITGYNGTLSSFAIPSTINGYTVTGIGNYAFQDNTTIRNVVIPDTVTYIGSYAFSKSTISTVNIPKSVTSVGNFTFERSSVSSVTFENTKISDYMFDGCDNLKTLVIPECVTSIGLGAFRDCEGLTDVTISKNVRSINGSAFKSCGSLKNITIENTIISLEMFSDCDALESVTIPEQVTTIGTWAFKNCDSLKNITFENTVIGDSMFYDCDGLEKVVIPDNITTVGSAAFAECLNLKSIEICEGVISVEESAFNNCDSLTDVILNNMVISYKMFYDCDALKKVEITDATVTIGECAFYSCDNLETVEISGECMYINKQAFSHCIKLKNLTLSEGIQTISDSAFSECLALEKVTVPKSITALGVNIFYNCDMLKEIELKNSFISENMFRDCDGLESIVIPDNISEIEKYAFYDCDSLERVEISKGVASIGSSVFSYCDSLTDIILNNAVIGQSMFNDCSGLKEVSIPENITSVGEYAFENCSNLKSVTVAKSGRYMFENCDALTDVQLSCDTIAAYMFNDCDGLKTVFIPKTVGTIGVYAFNSCDVLSTVVIGNGVASIGEYAFNNCGYLRKVVIPESVGSIANNAFTNCSYLKIYGYEGSYAQTVAKNKGITFVAITPLEITAQPADYTGQIGDTATFTVSAKGENLTYQWEQNTGSGWTAITSATSSSLSVAVAEFRDGYRYRCVVKDDYSQTISDEAVLSVAAKELVITKQPVNYSGDVGGTATFTVTADGENVTYQWQQNTGSGWVSINTSAGRKASFSIQATELRLTYKYRCIVSDGTASLVSNEVGFDCAAYEGAITVTISGVTGSDVVVSCNGSGIGNGSTVAVGDSIRVYVSNRQFVNYKILINGEELVLTQSGSMSQYGYYTVKGTDKKLNIEKVASQWSDEEVSNYIHFTTDTREQIYAFDENDSWMMLWSDTYLSKVSKFTVVLREEYCREGYSIKLNGTEYELTPLSESELYGTKYYNTLKNNCGEGCYVTELIPASDFNREVNVVYNEKQGFAITSQPVDYTGKIGDTAKFTVEATGAKSYQWYQNTGSGWVAMNTSAGRSKSISIPVVAFRVGFKYYCAVSDGTNTIKSDEVTIKLAETLAIATQPVDFVGNIGDTAKFTVEATGATSYQWYQNTGSGWVAMNTSAGRSNTISIAVAQFRVGFQYKCEVSDGANTLTSNAVSIKLDEVLGITAQPTDYVGEIGDTAKFTITATGVKYYQWQQNTGSGWVNINTAAGRSNSISIAVAQFRVGYQYRCMISDGTTLIASDVVAIRLEGETLAITGQPEDFVGTIGGNATFTVTATGATSYQWYQDTGSGWVAINTSSGRSKSITIPVAAFRVGYKYCCIVSDGTTTIISDVAELLI